MTNASPWIKVMPGPRAANARRASDGSVALVCASLAMILGLSIGCGRRSEPFDAEVPRSDAIHTAADNTFDAPSIQSDPSQPDADTPVRATVHLEPARAMPGDRVELSVHLTIAPPWEIHMLDAEPTIAATRLALDLPAELHAEGEWGVPRPTPSAMPGGGAAYGGNVVFTRSIRVADAASAGPRSIACRVAYQACDGRHCCPPTEIVATATLSIEPRDAASRGDPERGSTALAPTDVPVARARPTAGQANTS